MTIITEQYVRETLAALAANQVTLKSVKDNFLQAVYNASVGAVSATDPLIGGYMGDLQRCTRKAAACEALSNIVGRFVHLRDPALAERVPDVTPEKRAEHAEQLRGIFRSHGIDPRDFDACMDYIIGNGNIVPRYWVKIYMDYIHGDDLDATHVAHEGWDKQAFDFAQPDSERTVICVSTPLVLGSKIHERLERLIVTGQQASLLRAEGYTGELEIVDVMPGAVLTHDFVEIRTDQECRAILTKAQQNSRKGNTFPRGKAAARMALLGWVFND
nr:MAG: hypothetical protein [Bacteriophage sp.]